MRTSNSSDDFKAPLTGASGYISRISGKAGFPAFGRKHAFSILVDEAARGSCAKEAWRRSRGREPLNSGATAVDTGPRVNMTAVNPVVTEMFFRAFGTFTQDLADWFKFHGVTSIAMKPTGVYWIPAYDILKQHGLDVILLNTRYAKNVLGRKTDVSDASWLRQLYSYGLLRGNFRTTAQIATLRADLCHRERLMECAAAHI